jgi:hypothetical protein
MRDLSKQSNGEPVRNAPFESLLFSFELLPAAANLLAVAAEIS